MRFSRCLQTLLIALLFGTAGSSFASADEPAKEKPKPEFPSLEKVTEDFTVVEGDGGSFYNLWINKKTGQVLAKLPKDYATARHYIAPTVSGGEIFAGLQSDSKFVYWRKFGKRLAMMEENLSIKGSDAESKSSVNRLFTDRVLLDVPILAMDNNCPVINLNQALLANSSKFFNSYVAPNTSLTSITKAKAFPKNIEIAYEVPMYDGMLKSLHFSVSKVEGSDGFKPRKADERIGYFLTEYSDYGKYQEDETEVRYINRWHLEKRDPNLRLSPPKQPIVFYIEHTTPVRYRRFVREGIMSWNTAFENVGIANAIEVRQQDRESGAHMEKDPEDVRYNFVRWLNNNISTAIGPSRVNPKTGEILDADIVLTDGWIRAFESQFTNVMPKMMMEGTSAETLAWYTKHPNWDPRVRLAEPADREFVRQQIRHEASQKYAKQVEAVRHAKMRGERVTAQPETSSQMNSGCFAADGRSMDVAFMRMSIAMKMSLDQEDDEKKKKKKKRRKKKQEDKDGEEDDSDDEDEDEDEDDEDEDADEEKDEDAEQMLDGMPESFIGSLLADLVAHEVGHTMGLRHNFKASSVYDIAEMNSEELKGKKPFAGSVMDYNPTNFFVNEGEVQGDYAMIGVGPYDMWAIEYGYTLDEKKLPKILKRVAEPELIFGTDEDTGGPDPLAKRYDFGKNPLDFANEQIALATMHRKKIIDKFVKDGQPWSKARSGYLMTLTMQVRSSSIMANWVGGTFVNRDRKGDPNGRQPLEPVSAEDQRAALKFVIDNMFNDEAFGLSPELLRYMTKDYFSRGQNPAWPIHDRVMSLQASSLSQLMSPTRLAQVYDNEYRVSADEDALTLNELLNSINEAIWSELDELPEGKFTEREPAISSLRRNLQTEYLERLFDLAAETKSATAAMKPIANLASMKLHELHKKLEKAAESEDFDAYSKAHIVDSKQRVKKWIDSTYVMNQDSGGGSGFSFLFGKEAEQRK